jgi:hypothetical protein
MVTHVNGTQVAHQEGTIEFSLTTFTVTVDGARPARLDGAR